MSPPSNKGVKMFELAQFDVFTPDIKKGGCGHWRFICMCWQALGRGGMECVGGTWEWSSTSSEIMGIGGFDPWAANRGAYAGLVHGIASRPNSKSKPPATPATRGPLRPHPPNPWDVFAKAQGAISPTLDMQGTVC